MKKILCKTVGIIGIVFVCVSCIYKYNSIRGNGSLITFDMSVSNFDKIKFAGSAEVKYYASDEYQVIVTVDSNLEEWVEIYTKNNELNIGLKNIFVHTSISHTKYIVEVYCPTLIGVTISGSGTFESFDEIITSKFEAKVSGSGKIDGTVFCTDFSSKISGSGRMSIAGTSKETNISISGSGRFSGNDFETKNATVTISGSGKANIIVTDYLKAKISGSGEVTYSGDPKVETKVSGSGKVKKL